MATPGGSLIDSAVNPEARDSPAGEAEVCELDALAGVPICCGRPGEVPGNNCLARGPVEENLKNCVKEGKVFDGRRMGLGVLCCRGLGPADFIVPIDGAASGAGLPAGCDYAPGPPGMKVCLACGDGVCGGAEDRCNCPADCERKQP